MCQAVLSFTPCAAVLAQSRKTRECMRASEAAISRQCALSLYCTRSVDIEGQENTAKTIISELCSRSVQTEAAAAAASFVTVWNK